MSFDCIGLDFGTTNSALAVHTPDGHVALARFAHGGRLKPTFRSLLFFDPERLDALKRPTPLAGPAAIARYLELESTGRLIQSLKAYLASRSFTRTRIDAHVMTLEELIAIVVRELIGGAEHHFGPLPRRAVVGRPVHFGRPEDDDFAESRLRQALERAGVEVLRFVLEPVAAAAHYASRLDREETVLIADFGGGTSDFSLLRMGPQQQEVLGTEGVALAGDAFDARIVERVVSPALGKGSAYRSVFGKVQTVPNKLYAHLRRWHHLSFLKSQATFELLERLIATSLEPEKLEAFRHVIEADLGFRLHQAVERAKMALGEEQTTTLIFEAGPVSIRKLITRREMERWIAPELEAIEGALERLLAATGVEASAVEHVFMTGGSSLVPAVRAIFARRFGEGRLTGGEQLTSVVSGLARIGARRE